MAIIERDGYKFEIPDDVPTTGEAIIEKASKATNTPLQGASPYVSRGNQDTLIEKDKPFTPRAGDRIGFVNYFETAGG